MTDARLALLAESIELQMNEAFWALRPESLAGKKGRQLFLVGGAQVAVAPGSVSLQRNRARGLGIREPASEVMIDQILDIYQAFKVKRFSFQQSPCPQYELIRGWLEKRGFRPHHTYTELVRETTPAPAPQQTAVPQQAALRVERIGRKDAGAFAATFGGVSPVPPGQLEWIRASVGAPGFSHYLAYVEDRPAAAGMVYVNGKAAWMGWAGTLTPFRRRGAQTALIAVRVQRAAEQGARWVVCATMEPQRGRPSGSYRNLLKCGFREAYLRPIWVWEQQRGSVSAE